MSALNLSREARAYEVLKLCELAARGLVPDMDDADDESIEFMKGSYKALCSKIKYLLPRASALWRPEFEKALDSSHSIRIEKLDDNKKEARRGFLGTCMACGRQEKNCKYSIDLAGDLDSAAWLKDPLNVHDEYAKFCKEYEKVYDENFIQDNVESGDLPGVDKGCFVVGETCLRKAKLRYGLQTLLLEACYSSERDIEEIMEQNPGELTTDTIYTLTAKKCEEFVQSQDNLELAIADEKRHAPDIASDGEFWSVIDECRALVSGEDENVLNRLLHERALDTLEKLKTVERGESHENDDDDFSVGSDDEDGEEQADKQAGRRSKRKRHCVVADETEHETEDEDAPPAAGGSRARCAPSSSSGGNGDGEDLRRPSGDGDDDDDEDANNIAPPRRVSRREPPESISGIVGRQRATGNLPSRRDAVIQLIELQLKLQREDRARDSAICTNAILTLQELIQRVEELRHTV